MRAGSALVGELDIQDVLVDHHERAVVEAVLDDARRVVVKGDLDAERSAHEARVLAAAAREGVPVPRVLARAPGPPALLVLDHVPGGWLAPERHDRAWAATGAVLRRLHGVSVAALHEFAGQRGWSAGLAQLIDHWAPRSRAAGLADDVVVGVRAATACLVGARDGEPAIGTLHGDCVPIHVRLDDDEVVGLLDLGDACRGDAVWDLAVLTLRSPERITAVLDGYGADEALRRWFAQAAPVYRSMRLVAEVGWLAEHGYDPSREIGEATAAAALLR
jgi:Ser/Thr protein kinase RdoA (MazF antagonist)